MANTISNQWAAYGVKIISGSAAEWQIDQVKECAKKLKEAEKTCQGTGTWQQQE